MKNVIRTESQIFLKIIKIYFNTFSYSPKNQTYLFQLAKPQRCEENRNGKDVPAREQACGVSGMPGMRRKDMQSR